jgi:peptidoglycan/LPS O-acetylase OafA/YrhL
MQRMTRLDGLRGVLAVYVMLGHAAPYTELPGWILAALHHGEAAVDLFFCLSGLVVIQSLERFDFYAWRFLRARARRLLPVYFFVLAVAVALLLLGSPVAAMPWVSAADAGFWAAPPGMAWHVLAHLALLQGLIPQGVSPWVWISVLPPAWSLSTEFQFYLLVATLRVRKLGALAILLLGVAAVYRLLPLPAYWQFSKAFLPDAAGYFALGVASVGLLRGEGRVVFGVVFGGVCLLGLVSGEAWKILTPVVWGAVLWVQMRAFGSQVMGYARLRRANPSYGFRVLDWRVVQWLGAVSYPLYLVNEPVQRGCAMIVAPLAHGNELVFTWVWLPLAVVGPVLAAWVVHRAVEKPFIRGWVRKPRRIASLRSQ